MRASGARSESAKVQRCFLGWERPALVAAVEKLVDRYRNTDDESLNLQRVAIVVPGQRAGRRLRELLVDAAERERLLLTPPKVLTVGQLPEDLYEPQRPLATAMVQRLAWAKAVRETPEDIRKSVFPRAPDESDRMGWLRLGDWLGRIDAELAAEGHEVDDVIRVGATISGFADHERWQTIDIIRKSYHRILDSLKLWDKHAARLVAIEKREVRCDDDIILVGVVDLNEAVKKMLVQVSDRVTAFVFAPESWVGHFDEFGVLNVAEWTNIPIPLRDDQILFADDPGDQAATAVDWLAKLDGKYSIDDVVIGMPDPSVVAPLRRRLDSVGVRSRWLEERTLAESAPFRLLKAAAEFATTRRYEAFADLFRHPDVERWLVDSGEFYDLAKLDDYYAEYFPARIDTQLLPNSKVALAIQPFVRRIEEWLASACREHGLREWAEVFEAIMFTIYSNRSNLDLDCDADRRLDSALQQIIRGVRDLAELPGDLDVPLSANDAFSFALQTLGVEPLPPQIDPEALELLGWLELPLDDANAVLVTSFNEGIVPTHAGLDAFLPDALRRELGVEHDDRRYARDAYAVTFLANAKERFACIVARRDASRYPIAPSRFLFACPNDSLIERVNRWLNAGESPPRMDDTGADCLSPWKVPVPRKRGGKKKDTFRVTEFGAFIACPYRYYLGHVEKLSAVDDSARELDGGEFGVLIHRVLSEWGKDNQWRRCTRIDSLADFLIERLTALAAPRFDQSRPAIRLQLAQAARRLRVFAREQVKLVGEGWQTIFVECDRLLEAVFDATGNRVTLVGRIDRIDYHASSNVIRIIDYKTSDSGETPEKAHGGKNGWTDLQLPLYRHLWRDCVDASIVPDKVELAFFRIPKDCGDVGVSVADWDQAQLGQADALAQDVIRRIQEEDFDKRTVPAPKYSNIFAAICLDNQQAPSVGDDDENGDDA